VAIAARAHEARGPSTDERSKSRFIRRRARLATKSRMRGAALLAAPLLFAFVYVGMTAQLAAQTYRLSADRSHQSELRQTADVLGQRLAQAQALTQLERVAQRLHMTTPVEVVYIPCLLYTSDAADE